MCLDILISYAAIESNILIWRNWLIKSLWPSDAIWRHKSGSTLVQIMACYPTAPNHYPNQRWFLISDIPWHSPESNPKAIGPATILYTEVENYTFKITVTSPRRQRVKAHFRSSQRKAIVQFAKLFFKWQSNLWKCKHQIYTLFNTYWSTLHLHAEPCWRLWYQYILRVIKCSLNSVKCRSFYSYISECTWAHAALVMKLAGLVLEPMCCLSPCV